MPCFSASNVHFVSAQKHYEDRAKTAPRILYQSQHGLNQSDNVGYAYSSSFSVGSHQHRASLPLYGLRIQRRGCRATLERPVKSSKTQFRYALKSQPLTLNCRELECLQNAAKVITIEERLEALARREQLAKELDEKAEQKRFHFRKIDEQRLQAAVKKANQGKEEDEDYVFDNAAKQKILERAFIAKHEQEEEVKAVNRIILNAKCHAVRDAQVQEKNEYEQDQKNEESRVERLVIEESVKALAREDCNAEMKKVRNAKYADDIREQLVARQNVRFMEAERLEDEARVQRAAAAALKRDEKREEREAWERRQKFREELNRVVEMSNIFKKMLCEQEREADMRVAAYMRQKREREKELAREKRLAKDEFERQQQHLYDLAQKIADSKAHRDELNFIREQERVEREYRRREKELALRKKQLELDIKEARERQMQETKKRHALQIAREEKDFNTLIESLKKEEARLKKQEEERQKQGKIYRTEIIRQMSEKAFAKRRIREDERTEANLWREAENQRLANVRAVISAKLAAMREACLPERYIRDVERQLGRFVDPSVKKQQKPHSY